MSDKPADPAPPKSKKLLLIVVVLVLVLALGAGAAWFYVSKQRAALDDEEQDREPVAQAEIKGPPTYLPLDSMVVNLADPGGEKVAQIGITFELVDAQATEKVKAHLPTIRSSVLLLVSQRTSEELLQREGKEALAMAIWKEAARPFGGVGDDAPVEKEQPAAAGAKKARPAKTAKVRVEPPVRRVLFSSFIIQ